MLIAVSSWLIHLNVWRCTDLQILNLYKIHNMKQPVLTLCQRTAEGTVTWFGITLRPQFEQNAAVCRLAACVSAAWQCPASCSTSHRETDSGFKNGGLTSIRHIYHIWRSAIFTSLTTARHLSSTSRPVCWAVRGGGACLTVTATKEFFCRGIYASFVF